MGVPPHSQIITLGSQGHPQGHRRKIHIHICRHELLKLCDYMCIQSTLDIFYSPVSFAMNYPVAHVPCMQDLNLLIYNNKYRFCGSINPSASVSPTSLSPLMDGVGWGSMAYSSLQYTGIYLLLLSQTVLYLI